MGIGGYITMKRSDAIEIIAISIYLYAEYCRKGTVKHVTTQDCLDKYRANDTFAKLVDITVDALFLGVPK